ncbi:hypothetical protein, partial [Paraburkholderia fungorum]|uniref:hypothetical protein n=1 Tax=Paraburkholderia fungorum TaxID=134537 RepID=UPI001C4A27AE
GSKVRIRWCHSCPSRLPLSNDRPAAASGHVSVDMRAPTKVNEATFNIANWMAASLVEPTPERPGDGADE